MSDGTRVVITKAGGVGAITTRPMEAPVPGTGQVRVKVAYAGINFADLLMRMGFYQPRPPFPFTPGLRSAVSSMRWVKVFQNLRSGNVWSPPCETAGRPVMLSHLLTV